jgi:hypothetical protein
MPGRTINRLGLRREYDALVLVIIFAWHIEGLLPIGSPGRTIIEPPPFFCKHLRSHEHYRAHAIPSKAVYRLRPPSGFPIVLPSWASVHSSA